MSDPNYIRDALQRMDSALERVETQGQEVHRAVVALATERGRDAKDLEALETKHDDLTKAVGAIDARVGQLESAKRTADKAARDAKVQERWDKLTAAITGTLTGAGAAGAIEILSRFL